MERVRSSERAPRQSVKFWHLVARNCETCHHPLIPVLPQQTTHPTERCDPGGGWWWDWDNNKPTEQTKET